VTLLITMIGFTLRRHLENQRWLDRAHDGNARAANYSGQSTNIRLRFIRMFSFVGNEKGHGMPCPYDSRL